jgi:hypothetical protein
MFTVSNTFMCSVLHFSQEVEGAVVSAGPQLNAGGASSSADMVNLGPGGPVPAQQGYVFIYWIEFSCTAYCYISSFLI